MGEASLHLGHPLAAQIPGFVRIAPHTSDIRLRKTMGAEGRGLPLFSNLQYQTHRVVISVRRPRGCHTGAHLQDVAAAMVPDIFDRDEDMVEFRHPSSAVTEVKPARDILETVAATPIPPFLTSHRDPGVGKTAHSFPTRRGCYLVRH